MNTILQVSTSPSFIIFDNESSACLKKLTFSKNFKKNLVYTHAQNRTIHNTRRILQVQSTVGANSFHFLPNNKDEPQILCIQNNN